MDTTGEAHKRAVLQRYLDNLNAWDIDAQMALFAPDAVVEDPYGAPSVRGHTAIRELLSGGLGKVAASLDHSIRGSHGDTAAMAFTVEVAGDTPLRIRVIAVMTFDETGRITRLQAHWGSDPPSLQL